MPLVTHGQFTYPAIGLAANIYPNVGTAITGSGDKVAVVFQAPKTGNITQVDFLTGAVNASTVDARLETVNTGSAPARPSGTLVGTNTNVSVSLAASDDNVIKQALLTSPAAVTKGQLLAFVLVLSGAGSVILQAFDTPYTTIFPMSMREVSSVWQTPSANTVSLGLKYDDGLYSAIKDSQLAVGGSPTQENFANNTAIRELGNRFTLPFAARVSGVWCKVTNTSSAAYDLVLYEGSTQVASYSVSGTLKQANGGILNFEFPTDYITKPGQVYRIAAKPTSTTTIGVDWTAVDSAAQMRASFGLDSVYYTTKNSVGAWTDDQTKMAEIGVFVSAVQTAEANRGHVG